MSLTKAAEALMEVMTKQEFTDWYEKVFVPECIEQRPTAARKEEIKQNLIQQIKSAKSRLQIK